MDELTLHQAGVSEQLLAKLEAAGLTTVADAQKYLAGGKKLEEIDGVSKTAARQVVKLLESLASPSDVFAVHLVQTVPLGNGDRPRGEVLGQFKLAEGVMLDEFLTAIRNPHLVEIAPAE